VGARAVRTLEFILLMAIASIAKADYLTITRPATIRAAATRDSDSLARLEEGTELPLLEGVPTSGYFRVRLRATQQDGWVYRTFVERHTGDAPGVTAATDNPNDADYEVPTDHPWGRGNKSSNCRANDGLPDAACTPGDVLPDEDESVVCSADFHTGSVRDQSTSPTQKRTVYPAYNVPYPDNNRGASQVCEIDHLVALQLGGADTMSNLWPECSPGYANWQGPSFRDKDGYENYLWFRVCMKKDLPLHDAQLQIASDWRKYWEQEGKPICRNRKSCK